MGIFTSLLYIVCFCSAHLTKQSVTHLSVMFLTNMVGRTEANNIKQTGEDAEENGDGGGVTKIEFYKGETLRIQCKRMVKYRGLISWTTGDINTPLPPTAETGGSFLQIKQLNYSIPRLTCQVQKGMIKWTEEFKLQVLKNHEERGHKKHRGIPSALKAYVCESEKSEPLAEFSLGMVGECQLEYFQSYKMEPSTY